MNLSGERQEAAGKAKDMVMVETPDKQAKESCGDLLLVLCFTSLLHSPAIMSMQEDMP